VSYIIMAIILIILRHYGIHVQNEIRMCLLTGRSLGEVYLGMANEIGNVLV
jgi:hypothetical protein